MKKLFTELLDFLLRRTKKDRPSSLKIDINRQTIVLISGFTASRRTLSILEKRFSKDGFNVCVFVLDLKTYYGRSISRGLVGMAERLYELMSAINEKMKGERTKIFIIAHSVGGLVARYFIQRMGGAYYCNSLITLATPHRGSWLALLGFFSPLIVHFRALIQILPISRFIRKINKISFPSGFNLTSINSKKDIICSLKTTKIPSQWRNSDWIKEITLENMSHNDFLLNKESYNILKSFIKEQLTPDFHIEVK